ncbi:MAG: hypothetical protein CMQ19_06180 [Gammaproteobacteria bacterium]|nr:hypothetical protein [Gammaproteobacteria bacterium]
MSVPNRPIANHHPYSLETLLVPLLRRPKVAHFVKWSVYSLLLVNFGVYITDDWQVYQASLSSDAPLDAIFETFADTIDMGAWIGLVILLELETYILPEEAFEGWTDIILKLFRGVCYVLICYAAYGFTTSALESYDLTPIPEVTNLCDIANEGRYLQINIVDYEDITADNCDTLSPDVEFFQIGENVSLIGKSALPHVQNMGWIDISNAFVWILVALLIELEVALQSADIFDSRTLSRVRSIKTVFYGVLFVNAGIWAATGYPIYAWDAMLWIVGFWAIELNLAEWEEERLHELDATST